MFKKGDIAYYVFRGDWGRRTYNRYLCLHSEYYPFMPIIIKSSGRRRDRWSCTLYTTLLETGRNWNLPEPLIVKEFSLDRFILAQIEYKLHTGKRTTPEQFKQIIDTLGR